MSNQYAQILVALYDYKSNDDYELSLKKNEKLELLDGSGPWWKVRNSQKKEGFVPSNFCEYQKQNTFFSSLKNTLGRRKSKHNSSDGANSIEKSTKSSIKNLNKDPNLISTTSINRAPDKMINDPNLKNSRSGSEQNRSINDNSMKLSELNSTHGNNGLMQNQTPNNTSASFDALYGMNVSWCVARYDYTAQQRDEMTIHRGQRIQVLEKSSDGWWHGQALDDRTGEPVEVGWFPSNYVTIDQNKNNPGKYMSTSNSLGRTSTNGNSMADNGKIAGANSAINVSDVPNFMYKLSPSSNANNQNGTCHNNNPIPPSYQGHFHSVKTNNNNNNNIPPSSHITSSTEPILHRVLTLFPFNKIQDEELSFNAHEVLNVIEKPIDDPEWWRCRNARGEVGLVPTNYIKVLPSDSNNFSGLKSPENPSDSFSTSINNLNHNVASFNLNTNGKSANNNDVNSGKSASLLNSYNPHESNSPALNNSLSTVNNGSIVSNYNNNNNGNYNSKNGPHVDGESLRLQYASSSKKPEFKNEPWYWGNISRADCESMLANFGEIGDFVIRDSETHPGDLTVTMRAGNKNRNFKVRVIDNTFLIGQKNFSSLANLIAHYIRYPIYKFESDKQFLKRPFRHPGYGPTNSNN